MDGWNENAPLQPEVGRPGFNEDTTNSFKPLNPFRPISAPDHFQQQAQQAAQDQGGYYQPGPGQMYNQPWSAPLSPAQPMMPPQALYGPGGMQSGFTGGFQPSGGFQPVGGAPVPGGQPMPVQGGYQSFPPMFTAPLQPAGYGQQYPQQGAPVQPLQNMPPQPAPMQGVPSYSGPMQPVNPYAAQAPSGPYAPVNPAQQPMQGVSPYSGPMQPVQGMPPYGVPPMQPAAGYPVQDPAMQPVPGEQPPAQPEAPQPEPNPWNDLPPYPGMEAGANGAAAPEAPQTPQAYQEPVQPIQEPPRAADPPEEPAAPKDSDPLGIPPYLLNTSRMRKTPNLPPLKKPEATETPAAQKPEEPVYNDDIYQRPVPVQPETPVPAEAPAEAGRTVLMPPDRPRRRSHAGSAVAELAAAPQPVAVQPQPPADPPPSGQATRRRRSHHDVQDAQSTEESAGSNGGAAPSSGAGECHPFVNQAGAEDTGVESGSVRPVPACEDTTSTSSGTTNGTYRPRRNAPRRPALILRNASPSYQVDPDDAEYQQPYTSTTAERKVCNSTPFGESSMDPSPLDAIATAGSGDENRSFDESPFIASPFDDMAADGIGNEYQPFGESPFTASPFDDMASDGIGNEYPPFGKSHFADSPFSDLSASVDEDWFPYGATETSATTSTAEPPSEPQPSDDRLSSSPSSQPDMSPSNGWDPFAEPNSDKCNSPLFANSTNAQLIVEPATFSGLNDTTDMPLSSNALDELFNTDNQAADNPHYGKSSYDAGAMPNPSLGDLPYDAVNSFQNSNNHSTIEVSESSGNVYPDIVSIPETELEPSPVPDTENSTHSTSSTHVPGKEPQQRPILLSRLILLVLAICLTVFCLVAGGRILIAYVQNTDEIAKLSSQFYDTTGIQLGDAGETVQLNDDGTTFPPSNPSGESIFHSVLTGKNNGTQGSQDDSDTTATGKRTRLSEYPLSQRFTIMPIIEKQRKETPDAVGLLTIPGLLEEWIVSKEDVTYYLNHNIHNQSNYYGAVFLEQHRALEKPPENLHLRGSDAVSSTGDGSVFRKLWQYKEGGSTFTMAHNRATVITLHEQIDFELIAVIEASLNPARPDYFNYFGQLSFQSDAAMMDYVNNARRHSIYTLPADVQPGQRLLTLSTVSMASDTSMVLIFRSDRMYSDEYVEN